MISEYHILADQIEDLIRQIYVSENLSNIAGLDGKYIINEKQILAWQGKLANKNNKINPKFNFMKSFDECSYCSDEVMYFTAFLYLYQPFLINPANYPLPIKDQSVYGYYQNSETKRYFMYLNIVLEKLYNYWDKIGDYIAAHFPGALKEKQIGFPQIISHLKDEYSKSISLNWLKSFKDHEFKVFNDKRRRIVHYFGSDTDFRWFYLDNIKNKDVLEKAFDEINQMPLFMKDQMQLIRDGMCHMLGFIEEI